MLSVTRRQEIQDLVREHKSVTVVDLAKRFSVTTETIRRDLRALEEQGVLLRSYGGAFVQSGVENAINSDIRADAFKESKTIIGGRARKLIENGDVILLDNSTTAYFIAQCIQDMRLTVMTCNLRIIDLLSRQENIVLMALGGKLAVDEQSFYGEATLRMLRDYHFDKAFFSCRSVSKEQGVTDSKERWAQLHRTIIQQAKTRYLIADYNKFDKTSFINVCDFHAIDGIITDRELDSSWHETLAAFGVEVFDKD